MFFSKQGTVKMMILMVGVLVMTGCGSPLAVSQEDQTAPSAAEGAEANPVSGEIPDRQALAKYQAHLGEAGFERGMDQELAGVPGQIGDRQALANYQAYLGNDVTGQNVNQTCSVIELLPETIPDRKALAEYQAKLSGIGLCQ